MRYRTCAETVADVFLNMAALKQVSTLYSHHVWVILVTLTCLGFQVPGTLGDCKANGTTPGIRELVLGRCIDYKTTINPDYFCDNTPTTQKNCSELSDLLIDAFAYQSNCNISVSRFDNFIQAANIDIPTGKSLFWSGAGAVAARYSNKGQRLMTLEYSLIGYMINGLEFCGQEEPPGLIYNQKCDGFYPSTDCPRPAMYSFWSAASENFAAHASGEATVMLNASRDAPFRNNSFFASKEVLNLNPDKVTKLNILMSHIPGDTIKSTCSSANIGELKRRLKEKNIKYVCEDSPRGPQMMLCVDYPDVKECQRETPPSSSARRSYTVLFPLLVPYIVLNYVSV